MAESSFDFFQGSLRYDASASPDETEFEFSIHLNAQNGANEFGWLEVVVGVAFVGVLCECGIRSEHQFLDVSEVTQVLATLWGLWFV